MPDNRARYVATILQAFILGAVTYYGVKWLMDAMDPTKKNRLAAQKQAQKLLKKIGIEGVKLSEYELTVAADIVDPLILPITWKDIGGLRETIEEIKESVIFPIQQKDIFKNSTLLSAPKGVLLHGPPGCGKTMIAKATAKEAGCRFINLQVSSLTDKWYGESQKLAAAVFSLAVKLQPCIIFIDEIDSFLRMRDKSDHEATAMMKAQFMSLWDGLMTDSTCQVVVMGATNRPQDVDKAILRRMPCSFHVGLPDAEQRKDILKIILKKEKLNDDVDLDKLATLTEGYSGSGLKEICRVAAMSCVRDYVKKKNNPQMQDSIQDENGQPHIRPIEMDDLLLALEKCKPSATLQR
ncbi:ATPase family AAA domain-containing protein 1-like [Stylophora pistillata]|uniref:ATPase family AAA domain-containing protein 1 n=1 Tax=Stylophora pistillata TaxID=50429 RepID=A0A2B4RX59_STYPI|nr:ATPase family AAA domain-containing protein 1-like [Stylophora pistillata]PFX23044.1 ATPase family AAA domain-containing protein 1 [Stylophora pistillata]